MVKTQEALKLALEAAYLAGFNASGEGYNGEYPFQDHNAHPMQDEGWCERRDKYIREALADHIVDANKMVEQPAQQQEPVAFSSAEGLAWADRQSERVVKLTRKAQPEHGFTEPIYTSPPASKPWVGLTKAEYEEIEEWVGHVVPEPVFYAIEAKLREKNA